MIHTYPMLRSLDPHQQRIGYLGALASVATRGMDYAEALLSRYQDLLFEKIYEDEEQFGNMLARVPQERRTKLLKKMDRSIEEEPSAILRGLEDKNNWLYKSEFWLYEACMPSPRGFLSKDKIQRTIDLARWTGVLQPTNDLSETGYILQYLIKEISGEQSGQIHPNLLYAQARSSLPVLYFRILFSSEMLFPFLVYEFVDRYDNKKPLATRGEDGLLRAAVDRMIACIGEPNDPEDILAFREITDFRNSIEKSIKTEENYLRPRMEILVDLGVFGRKGDIEDKQSEFVWLVTDKTRAIAQSLRKYFSGKYNIQEYLDQGLFRSLSEVYGSGYRKVDGLEGRLYWFARALRKIGRDFGFTPGRTGALMACLMAWEEGKILEVSEVFDAVYEAARSDWAKYFHYSGGSRFDREFLIRVDDEFLTIIQERIKSDLPKNNNGGGR